MIRCIVVAPSRRNIILAGAVAFVGLPLAGWLTIDYLEARRLRALASAAMKDVDLAPVPQAATGLEILEPAWDRVAVSFGCHRACVAQWVAASPALVPHTDGEGLPTGAVTLCRGTPSPEVVDPDGQGLGCSVVQIAEDGRAVSIDLVLRPEP